MTNVGQAQLYAIELIQARMNTVSVVLLAVTCYSLVVLVSTQTALDVISEDCTGVRDPEDRTCGTVEAGACSVVLPGEVRPMEPPLPEDNTRSRFRSCVGLQRIDDFSVPVCEFDRLRFTDERLVRRRGPGLNENAYNYFKVFSRGFEANPPQSYPPFESAFYNVFCGEVATNSILSLTLSSIALDSTATCDFNGARETCVDFVEITTPTGEICKTCGVKTDDNPLSCRNGDPPLRDVLHFDGVRRLMLRFQANGRDLNSRGFRFLTSCVKRDFFFSDLCTVPEEDTTSTPPLKRKRDVEHLVHNMVPSLVRARRSYRIVNIVVRADTTVTYSNFTVKVFKDDVWLYKFRNIRFFQVFNFVVGFQTFSGDATPEGRTFPGYGILQIGKGIIQYIQTGIEPEFLPSAAETEIILRLRRRIVTALETNRDPSGPDEGDPDPRVFDGAPGPPADEIAQANLDAMMFGGACNGILRADACVYQELFFETVDEDCFDDDMEGST